VKFVGRLRVREKSGFAALGASQLSVVTAFFCQQKPISASVLFWDFISIDSSRSGQSKKSLEMTSCSSVASLLVFEFEL
jgi:hypothetical protein